MKTASTALINLFASDTPFEQFDLYTITLTSGLVLRYSTCSFDVLVGRGLPWLCARSVGGVQIDEQGDGGPRAHWTSGFSTGTWSVIVAPRDTDLIGNHSWLAAVNAGILDEAIVRVDRGYVAAWPLLPTLTLVPVGLVNVFYGRVAEVDFGRSSIMININDPRELLDVDMPRNVYGSGCGYALFDSGCTLSKAAFALPLTITGVTGINTIQTNSSKADGYFSLGSVRFTSGGNSGLQMMVRASFLAGGEMDLMAPLPFTINVGDTLTAYPGCDKQFATCAQKFNNLPNFGGFPFIPAVETAV
ncbi:DUF2163 domain-containing protein [Bradyrhizobium sp. RT10b]|uniref:DUF2163 domain-containing protein n=1 Tax=Bradyrhizobium sp. RT10b TaxID=3156331 RepID=UPI003396DEE1